MKFSIPPLRLGVVPYLNVQPLVYGLAAAHPGLQLLPAPPSRLVGMLERGEIDLGIAPVAALFSRQGRCVLAAPSIATQGAVRSVVAVSHRPIEHVSRLYRDPDSATSNLLGAVLARRVWGGRIELADWDGAGPLTPQSLHQDCAAIMIGDCAIRERDKYSHVADLGEAWNDWTGLPFVFAAWIGGRDLDSGDLVDALWRTYETNQERLPEIAAAYPGLPGMPLEDRIHYLTESLSHGFGPPERSALERFVAECRDLGLASLSQPIRWIERQE